MASGYGSFGGPTSGGGLRPPPPAVGSAAAAFAPHSGRGDYASRGGEPPSGPASGPFALPTTRGGGGQARSGSFTVGGPAPGDPAAVPWGVPPDRPPSEHSILRSGGLHPSVKQLGTLHTHVGVMELILMPWALLVLVLASFLTAGATGQFVSVQFVPVLLLSLSAWFIRHHYFRANNPEVILGVLCLVAIVIGCAVAEYAVVASLAEYFRVSQGASYFNVWPNEAAAGKIDATTLVFTNNTRVDVARSFGFTDTLTEAAPLYCVAPIVDPSLDERRIQYWAAGINCCEARGNFSCLSSESNGTRGAVVMAQDMQRAPGFRHAVESAEGAFGLTAGDEYLLVGWTEDPVEFCQNLWSGTAKLFGVLAAVYLFISVMIGVAVKPFMDVDNGFA